MGQFRKNKEQIKNECREIYKLRLAGNSYDYICRKLNIKEPNFFKTYYPVMTKMSQEENQKQFSQMEMENQDRIFCERLELYHQICMKKMLESKESPDWAKIAINIDVLLTRFRREGFSAFNINEYRKITQGMGRLTNEQGTDVLQEGDIPESKMEDSSGEDNNTNGSTEVL